jgi:8-oxo-dGTP pyrophosphatase MutT (NUDIX family)
MVTVNDLESLVRDRLSRPLPGAEAHLRFAPTPRFKQWDPAAQPPDARRAAALLLLYPGEQGPSVALTQRHAGLPLHGGQVSFPGGGIDPGETAEAAALREAYEEVGLAPGDVQVLGSLSSLWVIVSNYVVQPIVGITLTRPDFRPSPREVDAMVEAPLEALLRPSTIQWGTRTRDGIAVRFPYFAIGGLQVWGATAMMLGEFCTALDPEFRPPPA